MSVMTEIIIKNKLMKDNLLFDERKPRNRCWKRSDEMLKAKTIRNIYRTVGLVDGAKKAHQVVGH